MRYLLILLMLLSADCYGQYHCVDTLFGHVYYYRRDTIHYPGRINNTRTWWCGQESSAIMVDSFYSIPKRTYYFRGVRIDFPAESNHRVLSLHVIETDKYLNEYAFYNFVPYFRVNVLPRP